MESGWPGDVIITDDVMSLSRPNTLFFQPNKARLLGLFRAFLRASIVPMGMDTIPGISASIGRVMHSSVALLPQNMGSFKG